MGDGARGEQTRRCFYTQGFDPASLVYRYTVNERFGESLSRRYASGPPFAIYVTAQVALGAEPRPDPYGGFSSLGFGTAPITISRTTRVAATQQPDVESLVNGLIPEPVEQIMAMRERLDFTARQLGRLNAIRDSLHSRNVTIRAEVRAALTAAGAASNLSRVYEAIGSRINEGRLNVQNALDQIRALLRPGQWAQIPKTVRNAVSTPISQGAPR